jgi:hypothetical protein
LNWQSVDSKKDDIIKQTETYTFTLDDMKKSWMAAIDWFLKSEEDLDFNDFIKSLQQPKKEYIVELEMDEVWTFELAPTLKTKVDKEGYINVLSIKKGLGNS